MHSWYQTVPLYHECLMELTLKKNVHSQIRRLHGAIQPHEVTWPIDPNLHCSVTSRCGHSRLSCWWTDNAWRWSILGLKTSQFVSEERHIIAVSMIANNQGGRITNNRSQWRQSRERIRHKYMDKTNWFLHFPTQIFLPAVFCQPLSQSQFFFLSSNYIFAAPSNSAIVSSFFFTRQHLLSGCVHLWILQQILFYFI